YYDTIINPSADFWAKTKQQAVRELFSASGLLFDPEIVKAFIDTLGK
ncbi:MAG: phosphohydrolase, partial [Megasphaera micronuciformis]|nr:phosphohydrolase [Megasphaera micronuciformis]